jgi:DnaJ like chaperone protein
MGTLCISHGRGKLLATLFGMIIGYWLGGFFGLLIGLFLGQWVDRSVLRLAGGFALSSLAKHQVEAQRLFFEATFSVMGHIAKADGRVSEAEIVLARQVMQRMGLNETAQREAMEQFGSGKQPDFDLDAVLQSLRNVTRGRFDLMQMFIEIQLGAAFADGTMDVAERRVLLRVCEVLGFPRHTFERLVAMIQAEMHHRQSATPERGPSLADAYAILNIDENATDAEVKKAYRRLTSQHHPDKLAAKGLPPEMMKVAQEKTVEIRSAYERIKESRGFK